jgi:hypothetical protein
MFSCKYTYKCNLSRNRNFEPTFFRKKYLKRNIGHIFSYVQILKFSLVFLRGGKTKSEGRLHLFSHQSGTFEPACQDGVNMEAVRAILNLTTSN